jgi:hypothetical protein
MTPDIGPGMTAGTEDHGTQGVQVLWGYYDVYFDLENGTVEAVPNRDVMFTANVVQFVNNPASNLQFLIHGTPVDPGGAWIDVDIDVAISHPFPGLHQYDGWDVRGVFIGEGSGNMAYDTDLWYAMAGDQEMYDYDLGDDPDIGYLDPWDGLVGMPDGYTRWWNAAEFTDPGPLGFTEGALASLGYTGSATLNPYKYYCDGIGPAEKLWEWLNTSPNADERGIFTAGSTNTRNYYLRFPTPDPNVNYDYAITATWGEAPAEPPPMYIENCPEAVTCTISVTDNIYYVDDTDYGGNLIADVDVWGWPQESVVPSDIWQPSTVWVESEVFAAPVQFVDPPTPGGDNYSTWSCDLPTDVITQNGYVDLWVIAEYSGLDYTCAYPAAAPADPLAAFFRFELYIHDQKYCTGPTITDVQPPQINRDKVSTVTATGTDFEDGPQLNAWLSLTGQSDIVATAVNFIDITTVEFEFTLDDTVELDFWDFNMTHNDCPIVSTVPGAIEVIEKAYDIVPYDGTALGAGPLVVTVKGADYTGSDGAGGTVPVHGDYVIDLAVRSNDGGIYLAWAEHQTWDYDKDYGYVDRYAADMATVVASMPIFQYGASDPLPFAYRDFELDCKDGGGTNYGWTAQFGNAHIATDENMTPDAGYGPTLATWDFWGIAYGSYPYTYGHCVGAAAGGDGNAYGICAKYNGSGGNVCRVYHRVPTSDGWNTYTAYLLGNFNYSWVSNDDYDGGSDGECVSIGMGSTESIFFALREDSPHVGQYSNWYTTGITGSHWGADGTADGEISNPIDITVSDSEDRIYILDEPTTGHTRIQCFDTSGNLLAGSETLDRSTLGGGAPYRMDYNENETGRVVVVLYDNNSVEAWIDLS